VSELVTQSDDERSQRVRSFIASGGRVAGGATGAAIGLIGGPVLAIAGGAAGQAIGDTLAAGAVDFYDRVLSRRQGARAADALALATVAINRRLAAGDTPRQDFVDGADDSSEAPEVLEGTLLAAANAYEQRKVEYIGRFYANLAFDPTVSPSFANLLLQLLDRLTYGQLRVMSVLGDEKYLDLILRVGSEREKGFFRSNDDVVAEMDELSTMGLVGYVQADGKILPPTAVWGGDGISSWARAKLYQARLTAMGQRVHDLLGLADMPDDERDAVVRGLRGETLKSLRDATRF
jgi:hypothetical protein